MTCPNCSGSAHQDRADVNRENSAQYYDRVYFHCTNCGTWVTIETPITDEA